MNLYEKYRPQTFEEVLGQDKAVAKIRRIIDRGWGGQAFWISGASGTGKTTLACCEINDSGEQYKHPNADGAQALANLFGELTPQLKGTA